MDTTQIESNSNINNQTSEIIALAISLVIVTIEDYNTATLLNKTAKQARGAIEDYFKPMKDRAFASHREICKKEKDQIEPIDNALRRLSAQMNAFDRKIEVEASRLKAEEEARLCKIHEENQLKQAIALEGAGKKELAEKVLNTKAAINVQVEKPDLKMNDTKVRLNWRYRVVDAALVPREYLVPCDKQISARVKSSQGQCEIPGVEIYSEKTFY